MHVCSPQSPPSTHIMCIYIQIHLVNFFFCFSMSGSYTITILYARFMFLLHTPLFNRSFVFLIFFYLMNRHKLLYIYKHYIIQTLLFCIPIDNIARIKISRDFKLLYLAFAEKLQSSAKLNLLAGKKILYKESCFL